MLATTSQIISLRQGRNPNVRLLLLLCAFYGLIISFPGHISSSGFAGHLPESLGHLLSHPHSEHGDHSHVVMSDVRSYSHDVPAGSENESSGHHTEHDPSSHSHETPDRQDSPELRALVIPSVLLIIFLTASLPRLVSRLDRPPKALLAF